MNWNWFAAAAPVVGLVALIAVASGPEQGSGLAGGLGGRFRGALVMAAICGLGEGAAIAAILRNDRPGWMAMAMAALNLLLLSPGVWVLVRMDCE